MIHHVLAFIFFPVIILKRMQLLYLLTLLAVSVASRIYWPDADWLIFPICILVAVSMFVLLIDIRSWIMHVDESFMFIGKTIRDKNLHLSGDIGTRVSGDVGARVSGSLR